MITKQYKFIIIFGIVVFVLSYFNIPDIEIYNTNAIFGICLTLAGYCFHLNEEIDNLKR